MDPSVVNLPPGTPYKLWTYDLQDGDLYPLQASRHPSTDMPAYHWGPGQEAIEKKNYNPSPIESILASNSMYLVNKNVYTQTNINVAVFEFHSVSASLEPPQLRNADSTFVTVYVGQIDGAFYYMYHNRTIVSIIPPAPPIRGPALRPLVNIRAPPPQIVGPYPEQVVDTIDIIPVV
jgi:hypothetical protein